MITVYQAHWERLSPEQSAKLMFGDPDEIRKVWEAGLYREVATVHTLSHDMAYLQTNSVTGCWSANPKFDPDGQVRTYEMDVVDWAAERGCRSTSVGDVMLSAGQYKYVASFGMEAIDLPDLGRGTEGHRAAALAAYERLMTVDWTALGFPGLHNAIPWGDLRAAAGKEG